LELSGQELTVAQVMEEVLADRAFYENSGGGVTLSGGEPLMQPAFAKEILARSKAEGIHTAIETAGYYRWDKLADLLPLIDLVMMDLKHIDPDAHREATGVDNDLILANARRLAATDKPIIFRTPVIPTVNDTPEVISAIAQFIHSLASIRGPDSGNGKHADGPHADRFSLELLPFHRLATDKYRNLGMDYRASQLEPPSKEHMAALAEAAQACGIPAHNR
jgi:pyruvate formate lyase activating enzyme